MLVYCCFLFWYWRLKSFVPFPPSPPLLLFSAPLDFPYYYLHTSNKSLVSSPSFFSPLPLHHHHHLHLKLVLLLVVRRAIHEASVLPHDVLPLVGVSGSRPEVWVIKRVEPILPEGKEKGRKKKKRVDLS